jgi:hypothetical protein
VAELDRWLPEFDVRARHARELPVSPERALELALSCPVAPDPVVRVLLGLRGLRTRGTIGEFFTGQGFGELERTPRTFVAGAVSTPWRPRPGLGPFSEPRPGAVRMLVDVRAEPRGDGCVLSTETRVAAADAAARRAFRRYWLAIGPLSKLIRRRWLAAVARRAGAGR